MEVRGAPWRQRKQNPQKSRKFGINKYKRAQTFRPNTGAYQVQLKVYVVTWNVEGKGSPDEIDKALTETANQHIDIACLQEANFPAAGEGTEHYKWLCSGVYGSAILISKTSNLESSTFERLCDQICTAEVAGKDGLRMKVISCYIPPPTDYLSEDLWAKLTEVLRSVPSHILFVLAGDFNAQLGRTDHTKLFDGSLISESLHHDVCNENGVKLKKLIVTAHLRVVSTFGPHENSKDHFTYKDLEVKSQRDFIIIPHLRSTITHEVINDWHPEHKHAIHGSKLLINQTEKQYFGWVREEDKDKPKLIVSTWNIQSANPDKIDKVLNELNLPIVCIQDLFLISAEDIKTDNYTWFSSKQQWAKNVGIMIKTSPEIVLVKFESLSDCLCVADIKFHDKPVKVISCYLPTKDDQRHEVVTTQLSDLVKGIPEETCFFVAGDFNIKTELKALIEDKNCDDNGTFLLKLAEEMKLCMNSLSWKQRGRHNCYLISHVKETVKNSPHDILMPVNLTQKIRPRLFVRWIPFFENAIVSLFYKETNENPKELLEDTKEGQNVKLAPNGEIKSTNESSENFTVKVEVKNGVTYRTKIFEYFRSNASVEEDSSENVNSLSAEDLEKYKDTPPSPEDLSRILKDFVLFRVPNHKSSVSITPNMWIINSFREGKFGKLVMEDVTVTETADLDQKITRLSRIRWNGILLAEATGEKSDKTFLLRKKAINSLIYAIGQTCYTVKGKTSFFNKGLLPPMLMNDSSFADILKYVDKNKFPTMPDVFKHIDEFFSKDTECELVFGKEFTQEDLQEIKNYAKSQKLGFRFFKSSPHVQRMNHIALFIKQTPQYLRDKLIKHPEDFKYYLIPPCGLGKNYADFVVTYEGQNLKAENKLIMDYYNKSDGQKPVGNQVKKEKTIQQPKQRFQDRKPRGAGGGRYDGYGQKRQHQDSGGGQYERNGPRWQHQESGGGGGHWGEASHQSQYQNTGSLPNKRQKMDTQALCSVSVPRWRDLETLIMVWPVTIRSQAEERPRQILEANFVTEFQQGPQNTVATIVTLPMRNGREKKYCLSVADSQYKAAKIALQMIVKHSTVIKHNPTYLCNGGVPNFVRYKVPCQCNPRTYIILTRADTGPLSVGNVRDIFENFNSSYNEDIFFDKDSYTFNEKMIILEEAQRYHLKARHFGDSPGVADRYVCVYKVKPKHEILEEVLKMRGFHPKYVLSTDRLPPRLGLNIF